MKSFIAFLLGAITIIIVLIIITQVGLWPIDATREPPKLEKKLAIHAVHTRLSKMARGLTNPLPLTNETLISGMKIYRNGCAGCHGEPGKPSHWGSKNFYPRAPQLTDHPSRLSATEMFVAVKYGIRYSGMGASENDMKEDEMWRVVSFLSRVDKLPKEVQANWTK